MRRGTVDLRPWRTPEVLRLCPARRREETIERNKGSHQKKGAERFEERAESAHGGDVEDTQT